MPDFGSERQPIVVTLTSCDFPIIEKEVVGYGTALLAPPVLTEAFAAGAHAVIIDVPEITASIPDFGGTVSGDYSLLPHRDDSRGGRLRYLSLPRLTAGVRASSTVLVLPETGFELLEYEERFFNFNREVIAKQRKYDERFSISKEQYEHCFTPNGYNEVLLELVEDDFHDRDNATTTALNLLGYLIRGPLATVLMEDLKIIYGRMFAFIRLTQGQTLIIDNENAFHGRDGPGDATRRNFFVLE